MDELVPPRRPLRFGVFEADLDARELRKRGLRVRLPQQAFQVLEVLLERPGQIVSRQELQRSLWPADTYVEFDRGLNNTISRLRDVLDDSSRSPRFIETIPGRGYQFIAPVDVHAVPSPTASDSTPAPPPVVQVRRWWILAVVAVVLAVAALAAWRPFAVRPRPPAPNSLAVLPLTYTGAPGQTEDYLSDGMTSALIAELSKLGGLRVISETSSRRYLRTTKSLPEVARELGVEAIVEGSVVREGDVVRVTVQLIRADTDSHVWAETYTRGLGSMLALQNEVAIAIAGGIGERFTPEDRERMAGARPIGPEAYRLYVLGEQLRSKGTETELYGAIDHFQRALSIEPGYARAYCAIAESWIALAGWTGSVLPREGFPKAKVAAEQAIAIDPVFAEGYVALAFVTEVHDWDLERAEQLYRRALALSPNDALAHERYSLHLNRTGRGKEGMQEAQRAYELDPLGSNNLLNLGGRLVVGGKSDEGIAVLRKAVDFDPSYFETWVHLAEAYSSVGRVDEAVVAGKRALELSGNGSHAAQMLASIYASHGRRAEAEAVLRPLESRPAGRNAYEIALLHLRMGNHEKALRWLQTACDERTAQMAFIQFASRGKLFDPIRGDARFDRIVRCRETQTQ